MYIMGLYLRYSRLSQIWGIMESYLNLDQLKKNAFHIAIVKARGQVSLTARILGLTRASVYRLAKEYGVNIDVVRCENQNSSIK